MTTSMDRFERLMLAWYGVALVAYPERFRETYGREMVDVFHSQSLRRRVRGRGAQFRFWALAFAELIPSGLRVRLEAKGYRSRFAPSHEFESRSPRREFMQSVWQDIRFAARTLGRTPLVTVVALLTLALGIGANTAIFSVMNGVLFNPLSAPQPDRLVVLHESNEDQSFLWMSYNSFLEYEQQSTTLQHVGAMRPQSVAVTGGDRPPERIRGMFVTAGFFDALGEQPAMGRDLLPGEDAPGDDRVAVLSYAYWQRRYGGESILGQIIVLNNYPHTIVGVMPQGFQFPYDDTSAWISLHTFPRPLDQNVSMLAVGRLEPGATLEQAEEEMGLIAGRLAEAFPEFGNDRTGQLLPIKQLFVGERQQQLFVILLASVAMVLLIAAANVANLQLARATGRGREMAIRTAIGGERWRLMRQLLTENVLLAAVGGILGIAVAVGGIRLLVANGPGWIGSMYDVDMDLTVLGFVAVVSLATSVLFGLAPALRASRVDLTVSLREGSQALSTGFKGNRFRSALVVSQMALAVMLLIGAGLLVRSFQALQSVEVGFERDNLLTMQFRLPGNKYETNDQVVAFYDEMSERIRAVPGVLDVTFAQGMPFAGDEGRFEFLKDGVEPGSEVSVPMVFTNRVALNYFEAMGIPMLAGRTFNAGDREGSAPVAIVSQNLVDQFWPGEDVVGRTFRQRGDTAAISIVGVVGDIRGRGLDSDWQAFAYFAHTQAITRFATIGVRVPSDPSSYTIAVRDAIWAVDEDQPVWEIMSQNERIGSRISSERFATSLLLVFSAVAMGLAAMGIAGVIAYMVGQRRHEIGIRLALGAERQRILAMVMGQGAMLLGLGLILGVLGAGALARLLAGLMFGVASVDVVAFTVAPLLLAGVALAAVYFPARRASRVDPGIALRYE